MRVEIYYDIRDDTLHVPAQNNEKAVCGMGIPEKHNVSTIEYTLMKEYIQKDRHCSHCSYIDITKWDE